MLWLISNFKQIGIGIIGLCGFLLYRSNKNLKQENKSLKEQNEDINKIIDIQAKVIDVTENTKPSNFDGNIKRMQDGKL